MHICHSAHERVIWTQCWSGVPVQSLLSGMGLFFAGSYFIFVVPLCCPHAVPFLSRQKHADIGTTKYKSAKCKLHKIRMFIRQPLNQTKVYELNCYGTPFGFHGFPDVPEATCDVARVTAVGSDMGPLDSSRIISSLPMLTSSSSEDHNITKYDGDIVSGRETHFVTSSHLHQQGLKVIFRNSDLSKTSRCRRPRSCHSPQRPFQEEEEEEEERSLRRPSGCQKKKKKKRVPCPNRWTPRRRRLQQRRRLAGATPASSLRR